MRNSVLFSGCLSALALGLSMLTGCGGGGGGGGGGGSTGASGGGPLELMSFDLDQRTDVSRNQPLTFTFSTAIDPQSVSVDGFQVRSGLDVVQGRVVIDGNRITFFPTVLLDDRNDYTPPNDPPINGIGLLASTQYQVVALPNSPFSIKSRNGRPLATGISATFMTNTTFLPEAPDVPPMIVGDPVIFPERVVPGGSFFGDPNVPSSLPIFDPTSLRITIQFSEAMDPGKFNPFTTFTLIKPAPFNVIVGDPNDQANPCRVPGIGDPILGNIEPSPDATSYTFEPLFTLGDRLCTSDPFVLKFTVSPNLTDLAGNPLVDGSGQPLAQPFVFYFSTRDKPGEPNFSVTSEDFSSITNRGSPNDFFHPNTARWTGNGFLEGNPVTRRTASVVDTETPQFLLPQPLTTAGNRLQMLYFRDNFNNGSTGPGVESFISMSWGPKSSFVFASLYPQVTLKLGHTRSTVSQGLQATFDTNYSGFTNNPTIVYSGPYEVRNQLNQLWQPWPQFSQDFEYSGSSAVVWEANVAPAEDPNTSTYQLFRNTSTAPTPGRRIFDVFDAPVANCPPAVPPCAENTVYHQQFVLATKKSFGVSRYYNSGITNPDYTRPLVVFDANRGGQCLPNQQIGCFVITWEGADATVGGQVDANTATGFSTDINIADGHRFIRFEITLNGNPFTGVVPILDSLSFAYQTREGT